MRPKKVTKEIEDKIVCLAKKGANYEEIGMALDISSSTASKYARLNGLNTNSLRRNRPRAKKVETKGHNADRHLCRECIYRHKDVKKKSPGCDYYVHENKLRMDTCPVEKCTLFEKGKRLTKTD